ncbi:PDZ/DHR/GLGF domain protein [Planctopirus limnophila DSM 3776]|uniref:PDZ/DHR/GLGF domain protein n=1 Tax=Planctopirus limnophila (strain ATCC 43296 / DSM 3776 / IFAM 1008 / Mu 290) TaxID=521674 RepID=D5SY34_PLAL2|nr:Trx7/PDZ domain-containing (seleno)protein [Planctopirus limnophila]ADG69827.1 PDZ/DHR/GLGF domain protein [Planctopirus limnophila DSM 3776]
MKCVVQILLLSCLVLNVGLPAVYGQSKPTREEKVRADKAKVESEGFWIYNDLARGLEQAKKTGKPLVVVLRCIPCEECVKLDDDLMEKDPIVRPLLDQFVCVRIVGTNGLDLSLFQFDTDQSFAVFFLNADQTIYGRFGTRSHRTEWVGDVSLKGLAKALQKTLSLHADFKNVKSSLAAKRGATPEFATPEQFPALKTQYGPKLDYSGNVVKSCIHCHQIGDARRTLQRSRSEPFPEELIFPYPHPASIGLILDPHECATIKEVVAGSWGQKAGLQAGDQLQTMNGQPLLSMADVQWVLHQTDTAGGTISLEILRNGSVKKVSLMLPAGWRQSGDLTWRSSTWGLRRMTTGGMVLEELTSAERQELQLEDGKMALRAKYVGQYGPHAAAKSAGFEKGDVIVAYDNQTNLLREADLIAYGLKETRPRQVIPVQVKRGGRTLTLRLPMQE